jgi:hypothetical protein
MHLPERNFTFYQPAGNQPQFIPSSKHEEMKKPSGRLHLLYTILLSLAALLAVTLLSYGTMMGAAAA